MAKLRSLGDVSGEGGLRVAAHEKGKSREWRIWWGGGVGDASGKWKLFTNLIVRRAFVLGPYCSTLYLDVLLRPIVAALTVQRN